MNNRKLIIGVLGLAVLSVVLTFGLFSQGKEMGMMMGWGKVSQPVPEYYPDQNYFPPTTETTAVEKISPEVISNGDMYMPPVDSYYTDDLALNVDERAVEKYANYGLWVSDVSQYLGEIKNYFSSIGGVIISSSINQSSDDYQSAYLTVKVPVTKFDEASLRVVQNVKKVMNESVDTWDVTGQQVSLAEKLNTLELFKSQKELAFLEAKTEVEKKKLEIEIQRLNVQIDAVKKAQENAQEQIAYATLNLSIADSKRFFDGSAPLPILTVLQDAIRSLGGVGYTLAYAIIWIAVYSIIWLPILLAGRWLWRKFRTNTPANGK